MSTDTGAGPDHRTGPGQDPGRPAEADASLGELVGRVSRDFSNLVSTQVELAKVEIKEEIATAGRGAGMLGAGAFCAYLAVVLVAFAAAWGLSEVVPEGVAFLIVGAVFAAAAAVLLPRGRRRLRSLTPVAPQTADTLKEDMKWARAQMS